MKKSILFLSALIFCFGLSAQRIIESPKHGLTTASNVKIKRMEMSSTATVIYFDVSYTPNSWIRIPSKTFIQNINSEKKLFIEKSEGIRIDEQFTMPESGKTSYVLYFPPIDEKAEAIDYGEDGGNWFIYDIEIVPKKWISVLPETYEGNWFRTDGSNTWDYGLYENSAVYRSDVWQYDKLEKEGRLTKIFLKNDRGSAIIYAKAGKKGKLSFGEDPEKLLLYSKEYTSNPKYKIENDEVFTEPVFRYDSTVYRGYIKDFSPRMNIRTGMVHVNDILSQEQESYLVKINEDGTFESKFPLYHPSEVFVRSPVYNATIYMEPGKTTFQVIKAGSPLFMGECAKVNYDLSSTANFFSFDYMGTMDKVLEMSPQDYKDYVLRCRQTDIDKFNNFKKSHQLSSKAAKIREMSLDYRNFIYLLEYNMLRQSAYRRKNKIPANKPGSITPVILDSLYFDIVRELGFNEPLAVLSTDFNSFVNRVKFSESSTHSNPTTFLDVLEYLEKHGLDVSAEVKEAAKASQEIQNAIDRDKALEGYREKYKTIIDDFNQKNKEVISDLGQKFFYEMRYKKLKDFFDMDNSLVMEIIKAQDICQNLKGTFTPMTDMKLASLKNEFSDPFIPEHIVRKNNAIVAEIEANKLKTDYRVYDTPKTEADKIFDAIIEKFPGKVIYVDFWATWCGPCLSGIKTIAPLKEELAGKDIVFVYITNPSSPETTYKNMIPDIKGEHFRLNNDEWNYIASKFRISGIPHYALVNKKGELVSSEVARLGNTALKEMLMKYVEE